MDVRMEPRSDLQERLGLSDEDFEKLVKDGAVEVFTPPDSQAEMVPDYTFNRLVEKAMAALLREYERQKLEYRWNEQIVAVLESHPQIQDLMEEFLRYIRHNSFAHHFAPLKWSLRIAADGQYCNLAPTARGLRLSVTRQGKEQAKLIKSRADFPDALGWIRTRPEPWPMKGSLQGKRGAKS